MLRSAIARASQTQCRHHATSNGPRSVSALHNATLGTFRTKAFEPALPVLLPGQFTYLPAIQTWFTTCAKEGNTILNRNHLERFGSAIVPLEITYNGQFSRIEHPLSLFLDASATNNPKLQVYLAQAEMADLPDDLVQDVPVPEIVTKSGKGDIYSSSIWLGRAPTYTPLHRDPNPNLFVQLAGRKLVRMYKPHIGLSIFDAVQERIGGVAKATMRGEEMMEGVEREALEDEVWSRDGAQCSECWEAEVRSGDGLFIPKGWWHSIRSAAGEEGMIGSVNWWFR